MDKIKRKTTFLIIIVIIGIIIGIIFANILSHEDEKIVYTNFTEYFNNLANDTPIDYIHNLYINLRNNFLYLSIIWLLGLSIIGLLINNFILFFKSFIMGFSIGSIINIYLYRGIILSFIYLFPTSIINLIIFLILIYNANNFSLKLFKALFKKKDIKFPLLIKKYIKLFIICIILLIINSFMETFLTPFLIKLFTFLIK